MKVTDDVMYAPGKGRADSWMEDSLQWCMDADHSGGGHLGNRGDSQQAQQNFFTPKRAASFRRSAVVRGATFTKIHGFPVECNKYQFITEALDIALDRNNKSWYILVASFLRALAA